MKQAKYPAAVDIGNAGVKVLIADVLKDDSIVLLGAGEAESEGVKQGQIVDIARAAESIRKAVKAAEIASDRQIEEASVAISGKHIIGKQVTESTAIDDEEVSEADVEEVNRLARSNINDKSRRVIDILERDYKVDGESGYKQPLGITGKRMEGDLYLVTAGVQMIENQEKCLLRANLSLAGGFIFSGLAAAEAVLTDDEKKLGVCLVDFGAGTTEVVFFAGDVVCQIAVLDICADYVHLDIAQTQNVSIKDSERAKREIGLTESGGEGGEMALPESGSGNVREVNKAVIRDTIAMRMEDLWEELRALIEKFQAGGQRLSAGVVFVGDGALLPGFDRMAREKLRLNVRVASPCYRGERYELVNHPRFAVGMGLLAMMAKTPPPAKGFSLKQTWAKLFGQN